ncbi:unnamed protein product [Calypogeia fissa]
MAALHSSPLLFSNAPAVSAIVSNKSATPQCSGCQIQSQNPQMLAHSHPKIIGIELPNSTCGSTLNSKPRRWKSSFMCKSAAGRDSDDGYSCGSNGSSNGKSGDGDGGGGGFDVDKAMEGGAVQSDELKKQNNFLESLAEKVLQDEESKALLKEFATAAERVARAKQELDSIDKKERDLAEFVSQMINRADEESEMAALVSDSERAVLEAEEELKAAELALVTARAGGSVASLRKWESYEIDEDLERVESGKAAAVSVLAGTMASIPFYLSGEELGVGSLLSIGGVVVSCALFGVTYRYIVRRDLGNIQLKSGAAAAFSVVRGIGQVDAIQLQVGYPAEGANEVFMAALSAVQGFLIFGFSALALDYCLREAILSPFPSKKS